MPTSEETQTGAIPALPLSWSEIATASEECSVKDLKETARLIDGLKVSGSKQELIDRLKSWAAEDVGRFQQYFGEVSLQDGSPAVAEQLREVDTSPLRQLQEIRRQQELCSERLQRLSERADEHSSTVVERVRRDYEARLEALETESRGPREAALESYAKLREHLEKFEQEHRETVLEREELSLRHEVGELEAAAFQVRLADCEGRLEERELRLTQAQRLRDRFIEAVGPQEDLEGTLAQSAAAPAAEEAEEDERETAAAPDHPVAKRAATIVAKPAATPAVEQEPEAGATVIVRPARLISRQEDGSEREYRLGPVETVIGRSVKAEIRVVEGTVSRQHAKVMFGPEGFTIVDLGSENGTMVNGKRIDKRLLEEGDLIRIGPAEFEFRQG